MKYCVYTFNKTKPQLDSNGNPLYTNHKQYWKYTKDLLNKLGLVNYYKEYWNDIVCKIPTTNGEKGFSQDFASYYAEYKKSKMKYRDYIIQLAKNNGWNGGLAAVYLNDTPDYFSVNRKIKRKKCIGVCKTTDTNFIYLKINNEQYLSWNNIISDFNIKINSKAFFINTYDIDKSHNPILKEKVLALNIKDDMGYVIMANKDKLKDWLKNKYHDNLEVLDELYFPFNWLVNFNDVFTNKLLEFKDIEDYIEKSQYSFKYIKNVCKNNESIFIRYNKENNENKNKKKIYDIDDLFNDNDDLFCEQKNKPFYEEYKIKDINDENEVNKKVLKILLGFLYNNENMNKQKYTEFFTNKLLKEYITQELNSKQYKHIYKLALYALRQYELHKNKHYKQDKHISNQQYLSPIEKIKIEMLLVDKVFSLTNPYTKDSSKEQYRLFLDYFIKELFGKMIYESNNHNRFNISNRLKPIYEYNLNNTFLSDREFKLIIASIKDQNKHFKLKPKLNLKYKIIKALGLKVDDKYDVGFSTKTIKLDKEFLRNLFFNISLDIYNILLCLKIYNSSLRGLDNSMNILDEFIEEIDSKVDPPDS